MQNKKAPGPDNIWAGQLNHLGPLTKALFLRIILHSWLMGGVPGDWRRGVIVLIHRAGKGPKITWRRRSVALTSHMVKLA